MNVLEIMNINLLKEATVPRKLKIVWPPELCHALLSGLQDELEHTYTKYAFPADRKMKHPSALWTRFTTLRMKLLSLYLHDLVNRHAACLEIDESQFDDYIR